MSIKPRLVTLIIGLFLFVFFFHPGIYALIWPDCSYESSDGKWWDREVRIKGRGFDVAVTHFEFYKLRCDASTVKLVRTTRYITAKVDLNQDFKVAHQAAQKFVERLSSVKQPPLFGK